MNNIKRALQPAFANKKSSILTILEWFILQSFYLVNILFIQKIVAIIESGTREGAGQIAIIFTIVNLIYFLFVYLTRNRRWINLGESILVYLNKTYMNKFNIVNNISIENFGTGKIISILVHGLDIWTYFIGECIRIGVGVLVSVLATAFIIIQNGKIYHIVFVLTIIFIASYLIMILTGRTKKYRQKAKEKEVLAYGQFSKMIMSKFEILQNGKIEKEIKKLNKYCIDELDETKKVWTNVAKLALIPDIIVFLIYVSFLIILIYTSTPFSVIISFFLVISFLRAMIDDFVWFCTDFTRKFSSIEKLWDFFDNNSEIRGLETGRDFVYKTGNIELKNIKFSYGDNTVFDDFSLKIKGNKITAFVGESGGGKTTLMKLISGFIEPSSGEIIIDDQKLSEINFMSYYKDIGYLTQDPSVFDGTILENLTYGSKEKITEKRLKEVIKKSKCEFIFDFKKGLDTEIGERGVRLSGGQKQRLAIAKIFLKNPKIIFLDEPTSALDSKSEKLLHESFEELFKGRTVIIIAHRLQTVKSADNIFVFEAGKIVENGTHNSLIRKGGYYKEMLDLQSGF